MPEKINRKYETFVDECIAKAENPDAVRPYKEYILDAVTAYFGNDTEEPFKENTNAVLYEAGWINQEMAPLQMMVGDRCISKKEIIEACISVISAWLLCNGEIFNAIVTSVGALTLIFLSATKLKGDDLCVYLYGLKKMGNGREFNTAELLDHLPEKSNGCNIRKYNLSCNNYYEKCKVRKTEVLENVLISLEKKQVITSYTIEGERVYTLMR